MTDLPSNPHDDTAAPGVGEGPPEPEATTPPAEEPTGAGAAGATAPVSEAAGGPNANEAWGDVLSAMSALGDAMSVWAKAAVNEPGNKQHLDDLRSGVNEMARQADAAISKVGETEFGRQVAQGASQAGEALGAVASELGQAAAPHVATAFASLAEVFGMAAERVGETVAKPSAEPHDREAPEPPPGDDAVHE